MQARQRTNNRISKFKLSDALLIAISPAIAYSILFTYRLAFFSVFGLPIGLIEFTWGEVFTAALVLLALISFALYIIYIFSSLLFEGKTPEPIAKRVRRGLLIYIVAALNVYLLFLHWRYWIYYVTGALIFAFIDFIVPIFTQRGKGSYLEKLIADDKELTKKNRNDVIIRELGKTLGINTIRLIIYIIFGFIMVYQYGRAAAINQKKFYTVNTIPESVVLYMTNNKAILAQLDRNSNEIIPIFTVIELGQDPDLKYKFESIGTLTLRQATKTNQTPTPTAIISITPEPNFTSTVSITPVVSQTPVK